MTLEELDVQIGQVAQAELGRELGSMFMGKPDRWWDNPHWRCMNEHVSTRYLKSEIHGALCLAGGCHQPVLLTFPEDRDGPLAPLQSRRDSNPRLPP